LSTGTVDGAADVIQRIGVRDRHRRDAGQRMQTLETVVVRTTAARVLVMVGLPGWLLSLTTLR